MELSHNLLVNTKAFLVLVDVTHINMVTFRSVMPIVPQESSRLSFTDILRLHIHQLLAAGKVRSATDNQCERLVNGVITEIGVRKYKLVVAAREEAARVSKQRGIDHPELLCGNNSNYLSHQGLFQNMSTIMTAHYSGDNTRTQVPMHYDLDQECDIDDGEYELVAGRHGDYSMAIQPFYGHTDPIAAPFILNNQSSFDVGFFTSHYHPLAQAREGLYGQLRAVDETFYEVDGDEEDILVESLRYFEILRFYPLLSFSRDLSEYFHGNV